jgi:hypothetical protein
MSRLHSHSSRSYPGRSAPHCVSSRKARPPVTVAVMGQKSAEAIVDKEATTHGGVVVGNKPGIESREVLPCRRAELKERDVIPMGSASR